MVAFTVCGLYTIDLNLLSALQFLVVRGEKTYIGLDLLFRWFWVQFNSFCDLFCTCYLSFFYFFYKVVPF